MQDNRRAKVVIGADAAQCDLVFDAPSVSSRHCELSRGPHGLVITDTGSTNGTFVNGARLEPHRAESIAVGATIDLGRSCRWSLGVEHAAMLRPGSAAPVAVRATANEDVSIRFGHDAQQVDFVVHGEGVSGVHCAVSGGPAGYHLIDLGSTNGTWLHGNQLRASQPAAIREGDTFHLGRSASITLNRQHLAALASGLARFPTAPPMVAPSGPPRMVPETVPAVSPVSATGAAANAAVKAPASAAKWVVIAVLAVGFVGVGGLAVVGHLMESGGKAVKRAAAGARGPQTVADESVDLTEGSARWSSFSIPTEASVRVQLTADPRAVDIYLMRGADVATFQAALKEPGEKEFSYVRSPLSVTGVRILTQVDVVPEGQWAVVVHHPRTSLLDLETTRVHYGVTVE